MNENTIEEIMERTRIVIRNELASYEHSYIINGITGGLEIFRQHRLEKKEHGILSIDLTWRNFHNTIFISQKLQFYNIKIINVHRTSKFNREKKLIENYKLKKAKNSDLSSYLTQNYLYSKNLVARRLNKFNVRTESKYKKNKKHDAEMRRCSDDGKNFAYSIWDPDIRYKLYYKNNKMQLKIKDQYLEYVIINSKRTAHDIINCPNCGNDGHLEDFSKGCPSCKTNFKIDSSKEKIASVIKNATEYTGNNKPIMKVVLIIDAILLFFCIRDTIVTGQQGVLIPVLIVFPILLLIPSVMLGGVCYMIYYYLIVEKRIHNMKMLDKNIKYLDRYFSFEYFKGVVDHRLKVWAFEDNTNMPCIENGFKLDDKNIIDLEIIQYLDGSVTKNETHIIVNIICEVYLIYCDDNKLSKHRKVFDLSLSRKNTVLTNLESNFELLKCKNCGASISLLDGGSCKYCKTQIDVTDYDWVLTKISF